MNLVVLADDQFREELLEHGLENTTIVNWLKDVDDVTNFPAADAYIDLLFDNDSHRIKLLQKFESGIVIVNSVITTLKSLPRNFTRANGWPTFLKRSIIEVSCNEENMKRKAEEIFSCFHKKAEWVPDVPGFITLRVVAAIVNEAYFALEEQVSSKNEIDIAMKLGTHYPYGPFEWSKKIGLKNIYSLLSKLSETDKRYLPAPLLVKESYL